MGSLRADSTSSPLITLPQFTPLTSVRFAVSVPFRETGPFCYLAGPLREPDPGIRLIVIVVVTSFMRILN